MIVNVFKKEFMIKEDSGFGTLCTSYSKNWLYFCRET